MTKNVINHKLERWKPIKDFEGFYEASDMGRIAPCRRSYIGWIMQGGFNHKGYRSVHLSKNGIEKTLAVAKAILETFIGKKPSPFHQVNHKNGIKNDNRLENLEWITPIGNVRHARDVLGKYFGSPGEKNPKAKLSEIDVKKIQTLRKKGMKYIQISKIFSVTPESISNACRGKTWSHV